jgi:hypothetical protein
MAEYSPKFTPGQDITMTASATVTGGQLVEVTTPGSVGPAGAGSVKWLGLARFDTAIAGKVTVTRGGVQRLTASGGITAGQRVIPAAAGAVAAGTVADNGVGVALTTALTGALVDVALDR